MALLWICIIVSVIGNLWVVGKIWPVSKLYAIASFFFFPASIFFMFAHWGDDQHDIKVPFILTLVTAIGSVYMLDKFAAEYEDDEEEESRLYDGRYDVAVGAGERLVLYRNAG